MDMIREQKYSDLKGMVAIKNDSDSTAVISNEDGVTEKNHSSSSLKDTWMHMEKENGSVH